MHVFQGISELSQSPTMRPQIAVVFYGEHATNLVYAMSHPINGDGVMTLGRPVNLSDLKALIEHCDTRTESGEPAPHAVLPECVLHQSSERLLWYSRAQQRRLWFRDKPCVHAQIPALLWMVVKDKLMVRALASDERPTAQTPLFHAPFMNISQKGLLCLGTATLPTAINPATIPDMEACLFDAYFTHLNCDSTIQGVGYDNDQHLAYWQQLADAGGAFPVTDLIAANDTLNQWAFGQE